MIISAFYKISPQKIFVEDNLKSKQNRNFEEILNYIVKKGDTLTKIIKKEIQKAGIIVSKNQFAEIVRKVAKDNNIKNPDLIFPNQKLIIKLSFSKNECPVNGVITSNYGMRVDPFTKQMRFHEGIDISAPLGSPVKAATEGKVIYSGWMKGYGNIVIIKKGNIITKYAHNSKLLVKKGDYVKKGEIIAKVGSTGRSTGPHLHFEVIVNNHHIDPLKFLKI